MNTKEAYKQKIEAELELAQAKLAEFNAQAKSAAAATQIKHAKQVDALEEKVGHFSWTNLTKKGSYHEPYRKRHADQMVRIEGRNI